MEVAEKDLAARITKQVWRRVLWNGLILLLVIALLALAAGFVLKREFRTILSWIPDTRIAFLLHADVTVEGPVSAAVQVDTSLNVPFKKDVAVSLPLHKSLDVPVKGRFHIPLTEPVKCRLDKPVRIREKIPFRGTLPVDTRVQTRILGIPIEIPVKGNVPVDMAFPIDQEVHLNDAVMVRVPDPVDVNVNQNITLPVDLTVNTVIPINEVLTVPIKATVDCDARVKGKVPCSAEIEVVIKWDRGITVNGREVIFFFKKTA